MATRLLSGLSAWLCALACMFWAVAGCGSSTPDSANSAGTNTAAGGATQGAAGQAESSQEENEVVVYAALDAEFSEPVLNTFHEQTGTLVRPKYDTEAFKTIGLTTAIIQEAKRPRADIFWNNEIVNTLRLHKLGLLEAYVSPQAQAFPAMYQSKDGTWCGFAARARVLLCNKALTKDTQPSSVLDLANPAWRGKCGLAKPLFGTTASHGACLFSVWGADRAKEFFRQVAENEAQILPGNKQVAQAVSAGQLAFGLTDTDDALVELAKGEDVEIVFPDQGPDGMGTLLIPNTVAIIKGCPHPLAARRLVDYVLSEEVESRLALGPSGQIPLNPAVAAKPSLDLPQPFRQMDVDFEKAADQWEAAGAFFEAWLAAASQ